MNQLKKNKEKEFIIQLKPKTQKATSDRQLNNNIKLQIVQDALKNSNINIFNPPVYLQIPICRFDVT